ncbi:MAG: hypothetical protein J4G09_07975 [Proteobacteria bacterium]|nr:hypothetical protein [Pseudomonadota bacterium]
MLRTARVVAHRGGAGSRPENTLAAFAHALELGAGGSELDVRLSADGVPVVHHDERLDPSLARLDGRWLREPGPAVGELTWAELRRFDVGRPEPRRQRARRHPDLVPVDGERIPRLTEVLDLVGDSDHQLWVEIKAPGARTRGPGGAEALTDSVIGALRDARMQERALLLSFDWSALAYARRRAPEIPTVFTVFPGDGEASVWQRIRAAGGRIWFPPHRELEARGVALARAAGLGVATWTPNAEADLRRVLELGIDSICTDYPERLLALTREPAPRAD